MPLQVGGAEDAAPIQVVQIVTAGQVVEEDAAPVQVVKGVVQVATAIQDEHEASNASIASATIHTEDAHLHLFI